MSKQLKIWTLLIGVLFLIFLCWYFANITTYVIIAWVLTMITRPLLKQMDRWKIKNFKIPHSINVCLVILLILILFFGFLFAFSPLIIRQVNIISQIHFEDFSDKFRGGYTVFYQYITENGLVDLLAKAEHGIMEKIQSFVSLNKIGKFFSEIISFTGSFAIGFFSVFFITFFLLKDNVLISKTIQSLLPKKHLQEIIDTYQKIKNLLTRYFIGILLEVVCMMTLEIVGLSIFGIPNAFLIGFLGGLLNIIPYLGPIIGCIIGIVLALIATMSIGVYTGLGWVILTVIAVFVVANFIDNIVLQPIIYSKSVKAHPLEIFIVIIMGGTLAGISGMILAIPAYTVIRTIVIALSHNQSLMAYFTGKTIRPTSTTLPKEDNTQP